ncbi:MAG: hypothetical protein JWO92_1425 [Chitinophagaceae bacterium]|nr:hypothetical protein [Chitinophagaceae bacterium]
MKKLILLLVICSSTCVLFAQESPDTMSTNKRTKIKIKSKANPNDMTGSANGDINTSTTSTTLTTVSSTTIVWKTDPASLPVIGTGVPDDVVTNIKNKYGSNLYDIKKIKATSGQDAYAVRVMENGQYVTYYVGADGNITAQ